MTEALFDYVLALKVLTGLKTRDQKIKATTNKVD